MRIRKIIAIAEYFLLSVGTILVALYMGLRIDGEVERQKAIASFVSVRASEIIPVEKINTVRDAPYSLSYSKPSTENWSITRIRRFHMTEVQVNKPGALNFPLAILNIPKLGLEVPIYSKATPGNLNRGAALVAGTAMPDTEGNTVVAAHRDGYFRALKDISIGDSLIIETLYQKRIYHVYDIKIVKPSDISVLKKTPEPRLTLITCYPFYFVGSAPERYIVQAAVTK